MGAFGLSILVEVSFESITMLDVRSKRNLLQASSCLLVLSDFLTLPKVAEILLFTYSIYLHVNAFYQSTRDKLQEQ